jgi:hypothetical protein
MDARALKAATCKKRKATDVSKEKKPHDWSAPITATRLRRAKSGNIRTYIQGLVNAGTPDAQWMLVAEISERQSPDHHSLIKKATIRIYKHVPVMLHLSTIDALSG